VRFVVFASAASISIALTLAATIAVPKASSRTPDMSRFSDVLVSQRATSSGERDVGLAVAGAVAEHDVGRARDIVDDVAAVERLFVDALDRGADRGDTSDMGNPRCVKLERKPGARRRACYATRYRSLTRSRAVWS
jgi:hypothetical protein